MSDQEYWVRGVFRNRKGITDWGIQNICVTVCINNLNYKPREGETAWQFLRDHKGLFLQEAEACKNEWNNLKNKLVKL